MCRCVAICYIQQKLLISGFNLKIFLEVTLGIVAGIVGIFGIVWVFMFCINPQINLGTRHLFSYLCINHCTKEAEDDGYQKNNTNQTGGNIQPGVNDAKLTAQPDAYSLSITPEEANGNQNRSEPAYAGGWVNQS